MVWRTSLVSRLGQGTWIYQPSCVQPVPYPVSSKINRGHGQRGRPCLSPVLGVDGTLEDVSTVNDSSRFQYINNINKNKYPTGKGPLGSVK